MNKNLSEAIKLLQPFVDDGCLTIDCMYNTLPVESILTMKTLQVSPIIEVRSDDIATMQSLAISSSLSTAIDEDGVNIVFVCRSRQEVKEIIEVISVYNETYPLPIKEIWQDKIIFSNHSRIIFATLDNYEAVTCGVTIFDAIIYNPTDKLDNTNREIAYHIIPVMPFETNSVLILS